jgi:hypothetical protein
MEDRFGIAILDTIFAFAGNLSSHDAGKARHQTRTFACLPINGLVPSRRDYDVDYRARTVVLRS